MKKNHKKFYKYSVAKNGFALLYAVIVSSILLSIALGVSNIAIKEVVFSTSAKDANDAFYATDTAAECTLFYDSVAQNAFKETPDPMFCNNNDIQISITQTSPLIFAFIISQLGNSGKSCAQVTVDKTDTDTPNTKVTSVGYNNGGEISNSCIPTATSVQRAMELNY